MASQTSTHPIHQATRTNPYGNLTRDQFYTKHQITHNESFMLNNQNMKIFTQSWLPSSPSTPPSALIAMVHGYSSESSWIFELTAVYLARHGFKICSLDLQGHGRSEGRRGHILDINPLVDDCIQFFDSSRSPDLPAFLYGESLGGAIATLVYFRQKDKWDGLVLNGAMCGVSSKFKPPWPIEKFLPAAAFVAPNWRISLTKSLVSKSYREKWKRELVRNNPRAQKSEHPPAATAVELLRVCEEIGRRGGEVELPLLLVHGSKDSICDKGAAMLVYELAKSEDKSLKIVEGMWHQLIGEPEEIVELGFGVIVGWIKDRVCAKKKVFV